MKNTHFAPVFFFLMRKGGRAHSGNLADFLLKMNPNYFLINVPILRQKMKQNLIQFICS